MEEAEYILPQSIFTRGVYNSKNKTWNISNGNPRDSKKNERRKFGVSDNKRNTAGKEQAFKSSRLGVALSATNPAQSEGAGRGMRSQTVFRYKGLAKETLILNLKKPRRRKKHRELPRLSSPSLFPPRGFTAGSLAFSEKGGALHTLDLSLFSASDREKLSALDRMFEEAAGNLVAGEENSFLLERNTKVADSIASSDIFNFDSRPISGATSSSLFSDTETSFDRRSTAGMEDSPTFMVKTKSIRTIVTDKGGASGKPSKKKSKGRGTRRLKGNPKLEAEETLKMLREEWLPVHNKILQNSEGAIWRTIKVYVSSTFSDMHGERQCIHNHVIPQVNAVLAKHKIRAEAIDLRHGMMNELHSDTGLGQLENSLLEIESCPGFFVLLLGEQYGWRPNRHYRTSGKKEFQWANGYAPEHSLNAMEAYHAFLNKPYKPTHAICLERDPRFIKEISSERERRTFEFEYHGDEEAYALRENLREVAKDHEYCKYMKYKCHYGGIDKYGRPYTNGLRDSFLTPLVKEILSACFFHYPSKGEHENSSLFPIKKSIGAAEAAVKSVAARKKHSMGRSDADWILFYPNSSLIVRKSYTEKLHELAQQCLHFKEIESSQAEVNTVTSTICLSGEAGTGKTSLLCNFVKEHNFFHQNSIIIPFIIGVDITDEETIVRQLGEELVSIFKLRRKESDLKYTNVCDWFLQKVEEASQAATEMGKYFVIVVDGVDHFSQRIENFSFRWLPRTAINRCRVFVSCNEHDFSGKEESPVKDMLLSAGFQFQCINVTDLQDAQAKYLLTTLLQNETNCFHFTALQLETIAELVQRKGSSNNLLYIHTICGEIGRRIACGESFNTLTDLIENSFPDNLESLLLCTIDRVEEQTLTILFESNMMVHAGVEFSGKILVGRVFRLLVLSRHGMAEEDLKVLLHPAWRAGNRLPFGVWSRFFRLIEPFLLFIDQPDSSHQKLKLKTEFLWAVKCRYLGDYGTNIDVHESLSEYILLQYTQFFRGARMIAWSKPARKSEPEYIYDLLEIVYHQMSCANVRALEETLGNIDYIEALFVAAKCTTVGGAVGALIQYYRIAMLVLSRAEKEVLKTTLQAAQMTEKRLQSWFEGMWSFFIKTSTMHFRAPRLSLQLAINSKLDTPAQLTAQGKLKEYNKLKTKTDWNWIFLKNQAENVSQIEYELESNYSFLSPLNESKQIIAGCQNGNICLLNSETGSEESIFTGCPMKSKGHKVVDIQVSFDKMLIFTKAERGIINIWNMKRKSFIGDLQIETSSDGDVITFEKVHLFTVLNVCTENQDKSRDYFVITISDCHTIQVHILSVKFDNKCQNPNIIQKSRLELPHCQTLSISQGNEIDPYVFFVATLNEGVVLWKVNEQNFSVKKVTKFAETSILSVSINKPLNIVATGNLDGELCIWSIENIMKKGGDNPLSKAAMILMKSRNEKDNVMLLKRPQNVGGIPHLLKWYSEDENSGTDVLVSACQTGLLTIWKYDKDDAYLERITDLNRSIVGTSFNDLFILKNYIYAVHEESAVRGWDIKEVLRRADLLSADKNSCVGLKQTKTGRCVSADGTRGGSIGETGKIFVWNMVSGNVVECLMCKSANILCFSDHGDHVMVGTSMGKVFLWEYHLKYEFKGEIVNVGHTNPSALSFSADMQHAAVGCENGLFFLVNLDTKKVINVKQSLLANGKSSNDVKGAWTHLDAVADVTFCELEEQEIVELQEINERNMKGKNMKQRRGNILMPQKKKTGNFTRKKTFQKIAKLLVSTSTKGRVTVWSLDTFETILDYSSPNVHADGDLKILLTEQKIKLVSTPSMPRPGSEDYNSVVIEDLEDIDSLFCKEKCNLTSTEGPEKAVLDPLKRKVTKHRVSNLLFTGLTVGARIVCSGFGFAGLYYLLGFSDGTVQLYESKSGRLIGTFLCASSVSSISVPAWYSQVGHFICTDSNGKVYVLSTDFVGVVRRTTSPTMVNSTGSLLHPQKSLTRYKIASLKCRHSGVEAYSTKLGSKEYCKFSTQSINNSLRDCSIVNVSVNWKPTRKKLNLFWNYMGIKWIPHGEIDREEKSAKLLKDSCIVVLGNMHGLASALHVGLKKMLTDGVAVAAQNAVIVTNGIDNEVNRILAFREDPYLTKGDREEPVVIGVVPAEGVDIGPKFKPSKSEVESMRYFEKVEAIEQHSSRIIRVHGCRHLSSRRCVIEELLLSIRNMDAGSLGILISGDFGSLKELETLMQLNMPIIVVEGSGGVADHISELRKRRLPKKFGWGKLKATIESERAWVLPRSGRSNSTLYQDDVTKALLVYPKLHVFKITDPPKKLSENIKRLLRPVKHKFRRAVRRMSTLLGLTRVYDEKEQQ
jgi:hypothetical protein